MYIIEEIPISSILFQMYSSSILQLCFNVFNHIYYIFCVLCFMYYVSSSCISYGTFMEKPLLRILLNVTNQVEIVDD